MVPRSVRSVAAAAGQTDRKLLVAHIMVPEDNKAILDDCETKLKEGASFAELATTHSTCQSNRKGGELGWLERGAYFPDLKPQHFQFPSFASTERSISGEYARASTSRGAHLITVLDEKIQTKIQNMSAEQLFEVINNPALAEDVQFVDVREQQEWETSKIEGFQLMPLSEFDQWGKNIQATLDPSKETICLCHHGMRSMQMAKFLTGEGFTDVKNVTGGIDSYSRFDASVPIY
eukprot:gene7792-984_t